MVTICEREHIVNNRGWHCRVSLSESFRQQVEDQKAQVENLKAALLKLQQKLGEAQSKSDMLIAQHRRSRALDKATANPVWLASVRRMFDDPGLHITSEPAAYRVVVELHPS